MLTDTNYVKSVRIRSHSEDTVYFVYLKTTEGEQNDNDTTFLL